MNELEKKKFTMYGNVLSLLAKYIDLSLGPVPFLMAKLRRTVEEIERLDRRAFLGNPDWAIENKARRDNLIADLACVSSALFNYSRHSGSTELKEGTKLNQSNLMHLPDDELLNKAEALRLLALRNIAELRRLGITVSLVHNLGLKIEYFRRSQDKRVSAPKAEFSARQMSDLFLIADQVLENTDKLVGSLAGEFEEFYGEYISTRDFENREGRKTITLPGLEEDEVHN
ncbi:MAG TPA: hypothetical protein VHO03_04550 [Ignavibacteriales bacterium]|nr:hypothetical protein [Ignavibacteriales bacterium]